MTATMLQPRTHLAIAPELSGRVIDLAPGHARLELVTTPVMRTDERGLVHGGFVFSLADHAAMLAVNDPNVVLGGAQVRFLLPVAVGDLLIAEAVLERRNGRLHEVAVRVLRGADVVFAGTLTCFVLDRHVFDPRSEP